MQNMQNSLLVTERTSALWAVYGHFYFSSALNNQKTYYAALDE